MVDVRFKYENKQALIRLATINNFNDATNKDLYTYRLPWF